MDNNYYISEINRLKKEKDAVILAHYYLSPEIQDIADFIGDSYKLSLIASKTTSKSIIFCGVDFMAETAKILSPQKRVFIPVKNATCKMADMITEINLRDYKEKNPDHIILCYVNSKANIKALSDVCVTSSNAMKIIDYYKNQNKDILYIPDYNLASYAKSKLNYPKIHLWEGFCPIHNDITKEDVIKMKEKYPDYLLLTHPEARKEVLDLSDYIGSTLDILNYSISSNHDKFLIATEEGILHQLKKSSPNKTFLPLTKNLICKDMKFTTLEDVYNVLKNNTNEVFVDEKVQKNAKKALEKMIELS